MPIVSAVATANVSASDVFQRMIVVSVVRSGALGQVSDRRMPLSCLLAAVSSEHRLGLFLLLYQTCPLDKSTLPICVTEGCDPNSNRYIYSHLASIVGRIRPLFTTLPRSNEVYRSLAHTESSLFQIHRYINKPDLCVSLCFMTYRGNVFHEYASISTDLYILETLPAAVGNR